MEMTLRKKTKSIKIIVQRKDEKKQEIKEEKQKKKIKNQK
jgi:hypothetical protein